MIKKSLINGRGQLGKSLKKLGAHKGKHYEIYHTWNFTDKSQLTQLKEYRKFLIYLRNADKEKLIVFISTNSQEKNPYVSYKRSAEETLMRMPNWMIIRLPNLIGKGVCEGFKKKKLKPYGVMNLCSVDEASRYILRKCLFAEKNRIYIKTGSKVPATLVYDLILYGAKK